MAASVYALLLISYAWLPVVPIPAFPYWTLNPQPPPEPEDVFALPALLLVFELAGGVPLMSGVRYFAVRSHRNQPVSLAQAVEASSRTIPRLLLGFLIFGGIVLLLSLFPYLIIILSGGIFPGLEAVGAAIAITGFFAFIGIQVAVNLSLFPVVITMERAGVFRSFARSWKATQGQRWPLFGAYIVLAIVSSVVYAVLSAIGAAITGSFGVIAALVVGFGITGTWPTIASAVAYDVFT